MNEKLLAEWFWTDRWFGSSAYGLSIEARGLYREMLTRAWPREAQLPNNHKAIRRLISATAAEWRRTWPVVKPYWREDGDRLVNDTQRLIYAEAKRRFERAQTRGRNGATAKQGRNGNAR